MDKIQSIGELNSIINSKAFLAVLNEHKLFLQSEVNSFVEKQNLTEAFGALRALKDADRIVRLMKQKLDELKK
ncbi:MAG: hypothetical protein PHY56_00840 [Candidatus Omnitrophica bacterium]|nr:hypothetical protein [Candidatus Omnitrophota bacterium]